MSKDNVTAVVVPYETEADIGVVTFGGQVSVSLSKTDSGSYIVNVERVGDDRADVEIVIDGNDTVWEGNLA